MRICLHAHISMVVSHQHVKCPPAKAVYYVFRCFPCVPQQCGSLWAEVYLDTCPGCHLKGGAMSLCRIDGQVGNQITKLTLMFRKLRDLAASCSFCSVSPLSTGTSFKGRASWQPDRKAATIAYSKKTQKSICEVDKNNYLERQAWEVADWWDVLHTHLPPDTSLAFSPSRYLILFSHTFHRRQAKGR